ncbi:hypothetical protein CJ030_MR2G006986 [Morella rubra]|uniref:TMV resistance protein N n=1 Tax=Morella rubra TaxID=262757 RepID=A0A6A1WGF4_9ROSI|nr:hypothetical protein CJ030_MR2G006986 [Morella rubra]
MALEGQIGGQETKPTVEGDSTPGSIRKGTRLSRLSILSLQDCRNLSTLPSALGGLSGLSSLKVLELPFSRFPDIDSGDIAHFWKHLLYRTTIKFSNIGISMPMLSYKISCNSSSASVERFHTQNIVAFYIGFDSQHFDIQNEGVVAHDLLSRSVHKVIYGSSMVQRISNGFDNRSWSSSVTLEMPPDLDDKRKVVGYALSVVYETYSFERKRSYSFERICFDFHLETDEGPLSTRPLLLSVEMLPDIHLIWVCIPANWVLETVKNVGGWSYLKVSVRVSTKGVEVEGCGGERMWSACNTTA